MIEKINKECVNIPTIRNKVNKIIEYLNCGDLKPFLTLFPCGYLMDDNVYRLRLIIPGVDKFREENDSAIHLEGDISAKSDAEAIKIARKVAGALWLVLDLELFGL